MSFIDRILAVLAPHDCLGCSAEGSLLCPACIETLPRISAKRLDGSVLEQVSSVTVYRGIAKDLIWKLKSSGAQEAARIMAKPMLGLLPKNELFMIVPVPTATSRARQRGYDQAVLLAKELARQSGRPWSKLLIRSGQAHQVGSDRDRRLSQLRTALRLTNAKLVRNKNIILVDDVVTTGASLEIAASILKNAGASKIFAITFARPIFRKEEQSS